MKDIHNQPTRQFPANAHETIEELSPPNRVLLTSEKFRLLQIEYHSLLAEKDEEIEKLKNELTRIKETKLWKTSQYFQQLSQKFKLSSFQKRFKNF